MEVNGVYIGEGKVSIKEMPGFSARLAEIDLEGRDEPKINEPLNLIWFGDGKKVKLNPNFDLPKSELKDLETPAT